MEWSKYFQNPTYMEMTRKAILGDDLKPLIKNYCKIKNGMDILDIGCGTGSFTRYLADDDDNLKITGVDNDTFFIENAKKFALEKGLSDRLNFLVGDACEIPLSDNSFDVVVSHTFLTSIKNPKKALEEMKRVVRNGGVIASITAMSFSNQTWHKGYYPVECNWYKRLTELETKVWTMYQAIDPLTNYTQGIATSEIPHFFYENGLKDISIYPIGKAFSLSNAAMPIDEKKEYIIGMYEADKEKVLNFIEIESSLKYFTKEDCDEYISLLLAKRDFLLENLGENYIWEWYGGANVLITGTL